MSVERQYGESMLLCDECEDESDSDKNFIRMLQEAKSAGWLVIKDDDTGEWTHVCPACVKLLPKIT